MALVQKVHKGSPAGCMALLLMFLVRVFAMTAFCHTPKLTLPTQLSTADLSRAALIFFADGSRTSLLSCLQNTPFLQLSFVHFFFAFGNALTMHKPTPSAQ